MTAPSAPSAVAPLLQVEKLTKAYVPGEPVLRDINLAVASGEIVCLLGPSGCGKTTLLRVIAGLEEPDAGRILYAGADQRNVPVHARDMGFMFQDYALFPHKSVGENVAFGLRMAGQSRQAVRARTAEMLELVALGGYGERSVFDLSGGERQRVALARSLAPSPGLLMLDEPLGALDRTLREELMGEVRRILKAVGVTALYVTHDQEEAFSVADRIVVMHAGRIEQDAPPQVVHDHPASAFVARFLGFQNLLPIATVPVDDSADSSAGPMLETPLGPLDAAAIGGAVPSGARLLLIRPEAARFVAASAPLPGMVIRCVLGDSSYRGSHYRIRVTTADTPEPVALVFDVPAYRLHPDGRRRPVTPGDLARNRQVTLALDPSLMTLL